MCTGSSTGGSQGDRQEVVRPICFGTYNIRISWNGVLESALQVMLQTNVDLGVFQETKVTKVVYTRVPSKYWVVVSESLSAHSGRANFFFCEAEEFTVEVFHLHNANIFSFQLASGVQWWYIMGCYLVPDDASTIEGVVTSIRQQPLGAELLVTGDFNYDLVAPQGHAQDEEIEADLYMVGMDEMSAHLLSWHKDGRTWRMLCRGQ